MIEIRRNTQKTPQAAQIPATTPAGPRAEFNTPEAQNAVQRQIKPFKAIDGSDYRKAYRAVFDFHERHNPPRLDNDNGYRYWEETCDDFIAVGNSFGDDPFIQAMLRSVFEELERQCKLIQASETV